MSSTLDSKPSVVNADNIQTPISTSMPEHISLNKWEDTGFEWEGEIAPATFERLSAILTTEHEQANIQLSINLYRRSNVLHLAFQLIGR